MKKYYRTAGIFCQEKILPPALVRKILSANFLSCVNDYIEDMAT